MKIILMLPLFAFLFAFAPWDAEGQIVAIYNKDFVCGCQTTQPIKLNTDRGWTIRNLDTLFRDLEVTIKLPMEIIKAENLQARMEAICSRYEPEARLLFYDRIVVHLISRDRDFPRSYIYYIPKIVEAKMVEQ